MPQQVLNRGHTANLGAGVVPGNLQLIGVGATYTIAIGGGPAAAGNIVVGVVATYAINSQAVTVDNTTPAGGPANLTLSW